MNKEKYMITKNEFDILKLFHLNQFTTQRDASALNQLSLGSVNSVLNTLVENEYIKDNQITEKGIAIMQQYKVDNAIIMAAGMGSRIAPLGYENPKGLLKVRGEILIERQIKQLQASGIKDITLVLGYMKEKFFYLEDKFNVKIAINEDYYRYNNISTILKVASQFKNTYLCVSDIYYDENPFDPYMYGPSYAVVHEHANVSGEFYALMNSRKLIKDIEIGVGEPLMTGHAYFDKEFSDTFINILKEEFKDETTRYRLWEYVLMKHIGTLKMYGKEYPANSIHEFDSFEDLQNFDTLYITNTDSQILENITTSLNCELKDIKNIEAVKKGLTNLSFKFEVFDKVYMYRHPGVGTDSYINRRAEAYAQEVAKEYGLDDSFICMNPDKGWKIANYITDTHTMDYHNDYEVNASLEMIRKLHDLQLEGKYEFNVWKKTNDFIAMIAEKGRHDFDDFDELYNKLERVFQFTESDNYPKILCHCDFYDPNILFQGTRPYLIDWEYAGVDDPGVDLGTFIACSDYTFEEAMDILDRYEGKPMSFERRRHFIGYVALASYYWFIWAILQESNGATVGEYLYIWYRSSIKYANEALAQYGETL